MYSEVLITNSKQEQAIILNCSSLIERSTKKLKMPQLILPEIFMATAYRLTLEIKWTSST